MNSAQRTHYHAELWPAVCAAQGWSPKDAAQRRAIVAQCLIDIGLASEEVEEISSTTLDEAQITALFTFLRHLADPNHIGKADLWNTCRADYKTFNTSRQADHWQRRNYGQKGGDRLTRNRFAGRKKATPAPFDIDGPLDAKEAADRLMTMRARARRKESQAIPPRRRPTPRPAPIIDQPDLIPPPAAPRHQTSAEALALATGYDPENEDSDMPF